MATTSSVLKPDYAAKRKHFIFTDEHEQLRESIRAFVIKELAPHAEEWEETTFPDSVFHAHGRARLPRASTSPRSTAARAATTSRRSCSPRRSCHAQLRRPGDGRRGAHRHGDAADPRVRHRGAEAGVGRARDQGREDPLPRHHRARRRLRRRRASRRAPCKDGDEYVINGSKTYITNGHRADVIVLVTKTDPDAGYDGFTLFLVPMDAPGVIREKRLREARHARVRHRAARLPGRARARRRPCSARSARASTTSCGSSRASG